MVGRSSRCIGERRVKESREQFLGLIEDQPIVILDVYNAVLAISFSFSFSLSLSMLSRSPERAPPIACAGSLVVGYRGSPDDDDDDDDAIECS